MKLSDIFDQLSYGELSQLAVGNAEGAGILEKDYPMLISHINMGLLELHKRFDLRREELVIQQYAHIQTYLIDKRFATSSTSNEPYKYIMDSSFEPYTGNALKIERVFAEDGKEYVLNDDSDWDSLHTPTYLSLQVPLPEPTASLLVEYRANLPKIPLRGVNPSDYELDFPVSHLEALLNYVAYRVFAPLTDMSVGSNDSATYMMKFEASCSKLHELALTGSTSNHNLKFERNDWV
jgi:hypothetical protein